jgi:hypothetical protein
MEIFSHQLFPRLFLNVQFLGQAVTVLHLELSGDVVNHYRGENAVPLVYFAVA